MTTEIEEKPVARLFSHVSFHIILSQDLGPSLAQELTQILEENGAVEHHPPSKNCKIPFDGLTHIVSSTIEFEGDDEATTHMIPVVKRSWIYDSVMKKRLANTLPHSPDPRLFFSGLVVCTADLPEGDKDAIIGGVLAFGGLYSGTISKLVTHIVALSTEPLACKVAVSKNLSCRIVLPHWFDDCVRLGKRIDERPYLLPDPEILNKLPGDRITVQARPDLQGALSLEPGPLPTTFESPETGREVLTVFTDKRIMLSSDLNIADHLRETIVSVIEKGQGKMVQSVTDADVVVCQFRDGHNYSNAFTAGKTIGNLPWLYSLIVRDCWSSPLSRLLHYPIARYGLPGIKGCRICLSNYSGEARIYLENLAKAAGCEFTKTMKMDNTHLITAHMVSEKCDAAKEWNINIINHLWLEESYAKWQPQSLTNPRYTHFPPRTNLTEVVGRTPIDKAALERNFLRKTPREGNEVIDPPSNFGQDHDNMEKIGNGVESDALRPSKHSDDQFIAHRQKTEMANTGTPTRRRFTAEGKENETPSTTGSRKAKDKAVAQLHELAPDIALYEKEKKRVGGVVFGGRRSSDERTSDALRKRSASAEDSSDFIAEDEQPQPKKTKKNKDSPVLRLLVTGHSKWAENEKTYLKEREHLRKLGILLIQDYNRCQYLVAPKILRTRKFVCAIAQAPSLISTAFLDDCIEMNRLLRPEDYPLRDPVGEKRYRFKLSEVKEKAKANNGNMLNGQSIWITENIFGGFETYKAIIEANGGKCQLFRGRSGSIASSATDRQAIEGESEIDCAYLVSGGSPQEARLWPRFCQMARESNKKPRVVKTDWMLDLALSQRVEWNEEYEMKANDVMDED